MKVLQINQVVSVTSTGRIVESLGDFLRMQGHESFIAYSGRPYGKSNSILYRISNKIDTNLHAIGTRLFDQHGLYSKRVTKKFIRWVDEIDPDIIHLHNIHGYYLNYPMFFEYLKKSNKPVFWTFHDFWPITGHCSYFTDVKCEKWKTECETCPKLKFYPASFGLDNSRNNHKIKKRSFGTLQNLSIITISQWSKKIIEKSFLGDCDINSIPNGVNSKIFKPSFDSSEGVRSKYGLDDRKILIALATTWGKRKGYHDYLKLSAKLPKDYQIVLVGLSGELSKNLPENVVAIGRTDNTEELVELYNSSEINLNLSYQETFGLTTVEALMCGVPSIVYNATASPELVTDETGFVVAPGNVDAVLESILDIIARGGKKKYAKNCRAHALKEFEEKEVYQRHLNLYENAL